MLLERAVWLVPAALNFALTAGTISLASDGHDIAAIWPANAVLLAALLDRRTRSDEFAILGAGFLATTCAGLLTRGLGIAPFLFGLCNIVEVVIAAALLRPALKDGHILGSPGAVGRFIVVAGAVAPIVSGAGGASTAWLLVGQDVGDAFLTWVLSDGLGLLIFTPFFRAVFRGEYVRCFRSRNLAGRIEAIGLQALTAALAVFVFWVASTPMLFILFGPVMLATFRIGRLGTKLSVLVVAIVGTVATMDGVGPIADIAADPKEQAQLFQAYLAALLLTCLPAAGDLSARTASFRSLADSATALQAREMELSRLATTDSLTGVLNRAAFRDRAELAIRNRTEASLSLIALDLDRFKSVNDTHGHQAGDRALVHLVSVLQAGLRGRDIVGRVGGDEFLILLPSADLAQASVVADRLAEMLRGAPLPLDDGPILLLSMSCGVASFENGMGFSDWVREADSALYKAKAAGRAARSVAA